MTKAIDYKPQPAPLRGPKLDRSTFSDNHSEAARKVSIQIPVALANLAMEKGKQAMSDTNLHEITTAALRWFFAQTTEWSYFLFYKKRVVVGDLPKLWIPSILMEELQETALDQNLDELVLRAVDWFLARPFKKTSLWFRPKRLTFLGRDDMTKRIKTFVKKVREHAKANATDCAITQTKVVTVAIEQYLRYYLVGKGDKT